MLRALPPLIALAVVAAPASVAGAPRDASLQTFWTKFRKAALANDAAGIAALSAPVVKQHGDLDDSPKYRLTRRQVPAVLRKLLDNSGGGDRTQRQRLAASPAPVGDRSATDRAFRFGDMEFARGPAGWQLVRIYYESYE